MFLYERNFSCQSKVHKFKTMLATVMVVILSLLALQNPALASPNNGRLSAKKVVILVVDNLSLADIQSLSLPNFGRIINRGAVGLMSIKVNKVTSANLNLPYACLGAGQRVSLKDRNIVKLYEKTQPLLGDVLQKQGLKTGLIALNGTPAKYLLGNSQQKFDLSYFQKEQPSKDRFGSIDNNVLLNEAEKAVSMCDVLCIDYTQPYFVTKANIEGEIEPKEFQIERKKALQNADKILGNLMKSPKFQETALIVLTPNSPTGKSSWKDNFLTPFILYQKGQIPGLLYSKTTKRPGLISYVDFAPTVLKRMGIPMRGKTLGTPTEVKPTNQGFQKLQTFLNEAKEIKTARYITHTFYVIGTLLMMLYLLGSAYLSKRLPIKKLITVNAVFMTVFPALVFTTGVLPNWNHPYMTMTICLLAVGILCTWVSTREKTAQTIVFWASLLTAVFIIFDLLTGSGRILRSPLGFNDVFEGGRFYGINNDSAAFLIGSLFFALIQISLKMNMTKSIKTILFISAGMLAAFSFTPAFGANMGATIAVISITVMGVCLSMNRPRRIGASLILSMTIAVLIEILISYWDTKLGVSGTHAGRTFLRVTDGQIISTVESVIRSKISLLLLMAIIPPYNFLFILNMFLYYKVRNFIHQDWSILAAGALVFLLFNDTGLLGATVILNYLNTGISLLLDMEPNIIGEYGKRFAQKI